MFGIGKLFGGIAGGLLDRIGLGKIAPFIKLGIGILTGDWMSVAQDVFSMVSNFKGNFLNSASTRPPLGGFDTPRDSFSANNSILKPSRLGNLLRGLGDLLKTFSGGRADTGIFGTFGKIFDAFNVIKESFSNNQLLTDRVSVATFSSIRS